MGEKIKNLSSNGEITSEGIKVKAANIIFEDGKNLEEKMKLIQETIELNSILIGQSKI